MNHGEGRGIGAEARERIAQKQTEIRPERGDRIDGINEMGKRIQHY
jgi:hypothetical protein